MARLYRPDRSSLPHVRGAGRVPAAPAAIRAPSSPVSRRCSWPTVRPTTGSPVSPTVLLAHRPANDWLSGVRSVLVAHRPAIEALPGVRSVLLAHHPANDRLAGVRSVLLAHRDCRWPPLQPGSSQWDAASQAPMNAPKKALDVGRAIANMHDVANCGGKWGGEVKQARLVAHPGQDVGSEASPPVLTASASRQQGSQQTSVHR
jgi:hypothetical protein